MKKKYISVDIEASGKTPGKYSMLSLGACIVGNTNIQFYREIQPITTNYNLDAMKIACIGLKCLDNYQNFPEYNPKSDKFNPNLVLDLLKKFGKNPHDVMKDFAEWIIENTNGFAAVEAASPIKFDGMFTAWYFDNFYSGENPFGHSGEDINSVYRGLEKNIYANTKRLLSKEIPHNALDDAIVQAKRFEIVLKEMGCLNS